MKARSIFVLIFILIYNISWSQIELPLLDIWDDITLPASKQYNNTYNEVWGYVKDGREYAIIGSTMGTHIFDITNTNQLVELFFIEGKSAGDHIVHRDYHDYKGYLYSVSDEDTASKWGGLQIIDLNDLPNSVNLVYEEHKLIRKAHNIFIDTKVGKLYSLSSKGGKTGYQAMKIFSLENPIEPVEIAHYKSFGGIDVGHVHDAYVYDDRAYLNCGFDGLFIVDFKTEPETVISRFVGADYPEAGYNHSGWVNEEFTHYFFADETYGSSLKVLDIEDDNDIEVETTFYSGDPNLSIPHNILINKGYAFISYYYDGVQVYDVSNPANPIHVGAYATTNIPVSNQSYEGSWGVYPYFPSGKFIASDMQNGLFLFDCFDPYCNLVDVNEEEVAPKLSVFPNPATETISISLNEAPASVEIHNIEGQILYKGKDMNIDVSTYPKGMYIISCTTVGGHNIHKKVLINGGL